MNKKISILGAGESGVGAAILAQKHGFEVFVSDMGVVKSKYLRVLELYKIKFEENTHTEKEILESDIVIKSPGIPENASIVKAVREKGIELISEIEFASRYTDAKIVAVTGSNGKTTTAMLIYHILKLEKMNVGLAGNIGQSFAKQVAEENYDYYVLELSSFQLDGIVSFRPNIAVLLNITPDHLDRYDYKFDNYRDSKLRIGMNQSKSDYFIYDANDKGNISGLENNPVNAEMVPYGENIKGVTYGVMNEKEIKMNYQNDSSAVTIESLALQGKHNTRNSLAGGMAARLLGVRKTNIRNGLSSFESAEHRLEMYKSIEGINFINDSKATNVNSTFYALDTMTKTTVWIVGGVDKGNDYADLLPLVREKIRAVVCLGLDNNKLLNAFEEEVDIITETSSMEEAVNTAYALARRGDNVLLSPSCASFDLFESYEDRGEKFKISVDNLG
ncbi:MAG: UDP-N-acetylmuramoyl-L-alanine--D-glutamate ligase [Flavobacteriales bacterium]|nr:UDP-N-acetylmuramoyl-L-alanine--D-glutamate ligase [Flavobacteriales bacterium]